MSKKKNLIRLRLDLGLSQGKLQLRYSQNIKMWVPLNPPQLSLTPAFSGQDSDSVTPEGRKLYKMMEFVSSPQPSSFPTPTPSQLSSSTSLESRGVPEHPKVARSLFLYFGRVMLIAGILHLVSGFCIVSSVLTLATGALWMVACENSEDFDEALKKLSFHRELEGGCGSGITAIMGLSISGIVFSSLEFVGVVTGFSILWADSSGTTSGYYYCNNYPYSYSITIYPSVNPTSYFPGHAIATTVCNIAMNSLSIVFIRSLIERKRVGETASQGTGEYALPITAPYGKSQSSPQLSEQGHAFLRKLLYPFSQAMLAVGIIHLVSGFAVVSSSLTIAAAALWMNSTSSVKRLSHALEVNPDISPCSGLSAVYGIAISGILLSVIDTIWIPSTFMTAAVDNTFQVYCDSFNPYYNYYYSGVPYWNFFLSGQAIGCGITNIAFQILSLVFFQSLLGKRFASASENTPLMAVVQQPRPAAMAATGEPL